MAVEFALILTPFLFMTVGTLEVGLIHLSRSTMADAVEKTSRQIMTGSAGCIQPDDYIAQLCQRLSFSNGDCASNTRVEVRPLTNFTDRIGAAETNFNAINNSIQHGRDNTVMALRVYHRWDVIVPFLDTALGGQDGGVLLVSNLAFQNEPFGPNNGCVI